MAVIKDLVINCADPPALAAFWAATLDGYAIAPYDAQEIARLASLGRTPRTDPTVAVVGPGPGFFFQEVPEAKDGKNRMHLDVLVPDREAEVDRLLDLGASVQAVRSEWTVMRDPEGNEFCVHGERALAPDADAEAAGAEKG